MSTLVSFDPATGAPVGEVNVTPVEAIPRIVGAAREAHLAWADRPLADRVEALRAAHPLLQARQEDWIAGVTREMGKPVRDARGEVEHAVSGFPGLLDELARALAPEVQDNGRIRTTLYRDPFGVAACITPWNFPVLMPYQGLVPALAAGNAVVYKPSEETPLIGQAFAEALAEVLPDGLLQVIHGDEVQGRALVASDVDLVIFTGSREAGRHILAQASGSLKRVILELGGKDPLVVLEGADLARAARFAARNSFRNAGQVCVSTERIYVEEAAYDDFLHAFTREAAAMRVGPGSDEHTDVGPMVHARQRDHVLRQVQDAVAHGATVALQAPSPGGNFIGPTILTDCTHAMEIAREETFGPVACVFRVPDATEAVRLANDSPFGLGAVVFGPDDRARAVARRLTAGMIGVNQGLASAGSVPWVGARESGYGFHSGVEGHRQFAQVRVLNERLG